MFTCTKCGKELELMIVRMNGPEELVHVHSSNPLCDQEHINWQKSLRESVQKITDACDKMKSYWPVIDKIKTEKVYVVPSDKDYVAHVYYKLNDNKRYTAFYHCNSDESAAVLAKSLLPLKRDLKKDFDNVLKGSLLGMSIKDEADYNNMFLAFRSAVELYTDYKFNSDEDL